MSTEPGSAEEFAAVEHAPVVVVGVSPRTGSGGALQWAAEHAVHVGGHVRAVLAWRPPRSSGTGDGDATAGPPPSDPDLQREAQQRLDDLVATALGDDHAVHCVAVRGSARAVLLRQSQDADLLVLDAPRAAKLTMPGARLLAPQIVLSAGCPVVVMPLPAVA